MTLYSPPSLTFLHSSSEERNIGIKLYNPSSLPPSLLPTSDYHGDALVPLLKGR